MTKYQLEVEYDYDQILIGISCHAKDYRLCWALNQALGFRLEKEDKDIEIIHRARGQASLHSVYLYYHEENHTEYCLVLNKGTAGLLVPEQKQADYFLMIKNSFDDDIAELIATIRQIEFVLTAYEVKVEELKSRENLLF